MADISIHGAVESLLNLGFICASLLNTVFTTNPDSRAVHTGQETNLLMKTKISTQNVRLQLHRFQVIRFKQKHIQTIRKCNIKSVLMHGIPLNVTIVDVHSVQVMCLELYT